MLEHDSCRNSALLLTALLKQRWEVLAQALPPERSGALQILAESLGDETPDQLRARLARLQDPCTPDPAAFTHVLEAERPKTLLVAARLTEKEMEIPPLLQRWIYRSILRATLT